MAIHKVKQGECISRISLRYGFADWSVVYDHPQNAEFREKRPDPNLIYPGDRLFVPEREQKLEPCATGRMHRFQVSTPQKILKLAVEDLAGNRLANAPYELVVEGRTYEGTTDGDGKVEQPIPVDAEVGILRVGKLLWPLKIGHLNPLENAPDEGVSGIQARLRNLGYDPGPVDHELGRRTRAAIRAFQRENPPLVVDGICGPKTRAKLIERHGC
jgi:hypothetical protein